MIYSLQLVVFILCLIITYLCIRSGKGIHLRYLGAFFAMIALTQLLQLKAPAGVHTASFLFVFSETFSLLIPPIAVCYIRSSLAFQNHVYSRWLWIPGGLYLKAFSYLYVAGAVPETAFSTSTIYTVASAGAGMYNAFIAAFLFHLLSKNYADLSNSVTPAVAFWLKGIVSYLLFLAVISIAGIGIRSFYGTASIVYEAYEWFWAIGLTAWSLGMFYLVTAKPVVLNPLVHDVQVTYWDEGQDGEEDEETQLSVQTLESQNHYAQISSKKELPAEVRAKYVESLRHAMEVKEVYLDSKLTLSGLAKIINISPHQLSYIINSEWEMNFNEFVNSYRINKAQILLKDINYQTATIFAIGVDSGFNSESSFYTSFKKATGYSPKRYREALKLTSDL